MALANELIENNNKIFVEATQHVFLKDLGNGTINPKFVENFLNQDRIFALGYCKWLNSIASRIPLLENSNELNVEQVDLLHLLSFAVSNGLREVNMFPNTLNSLSLNYNERATANSACINYIRYLYGLNNNEDCLVALWALEKVYLEGWAFAKQLKSSSPYQELLNNWTTETFIKFVDHDLNYQVQNIVNKDIPRFNQIFVDICQLEINFWNESQM